MKVLKLKWMLVKGGLARFKGSLVRSLRSLLVFGAQQVAFGLWCAPCGRFWSLGRNKVAFGRGSKLFFLLGAGNQY